MKILFTTHQGNLAGSTLSLIYLARGLADKGHEVHLACRKGVLVEKELLNHVNITIHHIPFKSYIDFNACLKLQRVIKQHQIQVLNAQGGKDRNLTILSKWIFGLNVKLVFTRRQQPRNEPWIKRWFHTISTEQIIMISEGLKAIFVEKGYNPNHLKVIRNGVPNDLADRVNDTDVNKLRQKLNLEGKIVIGCLARLKSQKQVVEALQFLPSDYVVLFVGISESELNQQQIRQRLIFTGQVEHLQALHYLKLMTVNILPSYLDGFGLVLVESMLFGIPVIGSRFGGIPDVIRDGENGFLFENGNVQDLTEKIIKLVEDRDLRESFVENGLQIAKDQFSMSRVVREYERLFESLI